ncbi:MAG: PBP1A family penicillin-binding protein [Deltaproteobacteria bacterium]|nr:PBP1A family penicillin-binding protein [Deltaproteobacteria bacterium]
MSLLRSRRLYITLLVITANIALFGLGFHATFVHDLPDFRAPEDYEPFLTSIVYDRDGLPIGEYFEERRRLAPYDEIPKHVVYAFVAGEDGTFFTHAGIDYVSILRAAWVNFRAGHKVQGGSTITQQVAKSLVGSEKSYTRKIKEMLLARRMEENLSKEEILYLYLNQLYLGSGSYGVTEATRRYFGVELSEITVSQAAIIAGLPKAPSNYSPIRNPTRAEERRLYVLREMRQSNFIDEETYEAALIEPTVLARPPEYQDYDPARYFTEEVRRYLVKRIGEEALNQGGLHIETTMDLELQRTAVQTLKKGLETLDHRQGYRGPERRVPVEELEVTLLELGIENQLVPEEEEEGENAEVEELAAADGAALPEEVPGEVSDPAEASSTDSGEEENTALVVELPIGEPLVGVVLEVDEPGQRALIGFGHQLTYPLELETVKWARTPDPNRRSRPVTSISKIIEVGDVTSFILLPPDPEAKVEEGEANLARLDIFQIPAAQGALLSMEIATGDVLAMVGGYDYYANQFNRTTQALRQPGSALKPLIYASALQQGYTPVSIINDTAVVYKNRDGSIWKPKNYTPYFHGPVTLRESLVRSYNTATIRLFRDLGIRNVVNYLRLLGIQSPLDGDLSLALGSSSITLLELTRAYAVFPSGGKRVIPRFIRRVTDRHGNVLFENLELGNLEATRLAAEEAARLPEEHLIDEETEPVPVEPEEDGEVAEEIVDPDQLIPATEAYLATDMVRAIVTDPKGTGRRARGLGRPVGGKTGTTNQQADAWFVGFSPDIATGVWVGHDVSRVLGKGETGARAALPIWIGFMDQALRNYPKRDFSIPPEISFTRVSRKNGLLAGGDGEDSYFQAFIEGTEPTETSVTRPPLRFDEF